MLDYIPDGYTDSAFIKGVANIHGDVRITFRPMTMEVREPLLAYFNSPDKRSSVYYGKLAKLLAEVHLKSWSLVDAQGGSLPITIDNILRLKPVLLLSIQAIVLGLDGGDPDPETTAVERAATAETLLEAALSGQSPGIAKLEADLKNCGPASG